MDTLRDYTGFEADIRVAFGPIMKDYGFTLTETSEGFFELNNEKCVITISFDRGDVFCNIRKPEGKNSYQLWSVYRYLFKNESQDTSWYEAKIQLKKLATIAVKKLSNVLEGDFSWADGYELEREKLRKMIRYVSNEMNVNHPIYQKYRQDDPTWIKDLENYILSNNILLT